MAKKGGYVPLIQKMCNAAYFHTSCIILSISYFVVHMPYFVHRTLYSIVFKYTLIKIYMYIGISSAGLKYFVLQKIPNGRFSQSHPQMFLSNLLVLTYLLPKLILLLHITGCFNLEIDRQEVLGYIYIYIYVNSN